jgi:hypothetical protein
MKNRIWNREHDHEAGLARRTCLGRSARAEPNSRTSSSRGRGKNEDRGKGNPSGACTRGNGSKRRQGSGNRISEHRSKAGTKNQYRKLVTRDEDQRTKTGPKSAERRTENSDLSGTVNESRPKKSGQRSLDRRKSTRRGRKKSLRDQTGGQKNCWRLEQKNSRETKKDRRSGARTRRNEHEEPAHAGAASRTEPAAVDTNREEAEQKIKNDGETKPATTNSNNSAQI